MLYTHLQHHNNTIITTDAVTNNAKIMIKMQEDFFTNILPLTLLQGFEKVVWGFTVRRSWRPTINCNILTPNLWPSRCVFLVLLMLNRRPRVSLCWVMAFFIASYQHLLQTSAHQGPRPLWPGVAFPTTSRLQLSGSLLATPLAPWTSNSTGTGTQFNWLVELNWII